MTDRVLFAGGEAESYEYSGSQSFNTSGTFDSSYSRVGVTGPEWAGVYARFTDDTGALDTVVSGDTLWVHSYLVRTGAMHSGLPQLLEIRNSSDQAFVRLICVSTVGVQVQVNTNTGASPTWVTVAGYSDLPAFTPGVDIDIKVALGSPHLLEWSIGQSFCGAHSWTNANLTNLANLRLCGNGNQNVFHSQVLATRGIPTVGAKVKTIVADGAGANSGLTGAYTDINEAALDDTTYLTAASAGLKSTFTYGNVTVPTNMIIQGVFLWSRARHGGSSPTNIKAVCRRGGVDYTTGNSSYLGVTSSFRAQCHRFDVDPSTSAAWTETNLNAAEFGLETAA